MRLILLGTVFPSRRKVEGEESYTALLGYPDKGS